MGRNSQVFTWKVNSKAIAAVSPHTSTGFSSSDSEGELVLQQYLA